MVVVEGKLRTVDARRVARRRVLHVTSQSLLRHNAFHSHRRTTRAPPTRISRSNANCRPT